MASSTEIIIDGDHSVELIVRDALSLPADSGFSTSASDAIIPLLEPTGRPKIHIFSPSNGHNRMPREQVTRVMEPETSSFIQFSYFVWGGSRYSGLLCMVFSSGIYFLMEVVSDVLSVQSIPLFETVFVRCAIILLLSYLWLRRSALQTFGPPSARKLLVLRGLVGSLSLFSFIYSIQMSPLSQAIFLSFTTPIMASIVARFILHEKLEIIDIGGLACSFFGVIFIFYSGLTTQEIKDTNSNGRHHMYAVLIGLFSSAMGGISYCLIRAGAKASDQSVVTVFSFGLLACPAAAICMFTLQDFLLPGFYSFFCMILLGVLAFFAEILFARGLQLEKTCKGANILFIQAVLSQVWMISSSRAALSFGPIVGCLLILISVFSTIFMGPDKETE